MGEAAIPLLSLMGTLSHIQASCGQVRPHGGGAQECQQWATLLGLQNLISRSRHDLPGLCGTSQTFTLLVRTDMTVRVQRYPRLSGDFGWYLCQFCLVKKREDKGSSTVERKGNDFS